MAIVVWNCALGDAPSVVLPCGPVVAIAPRDDSVDTNTIEIAGTGTINSFGDGPLVTKQVHFPAGVTLHHNPPALVLLTAQDRVISGAAVGSYKCDGTGNWTEISFGESGAETSLENRVASLEARMTAAEGRLTANETAIANTANYLQAFIDHVNPILADHESRIAVLESKVP